jgi:hypothetical protein
MTGDLSATLLSGGSGQKAAGGIDAYPKAEDQSLLGAAAFMNAFTSACSFWMES